MKKSLSLMAIALAFSPVAAFAQDSSVIIQDSTNSAASVGVGNTVIQNTEQTSIQDQYGIGGHSSKPGAQQSIQQSRNEAAAVGNFNTIKQNTQQTSIQDRVDVDRYLSPYLDH